MLETIKWRNGKVVMIDQRRLPNRETYITCTSHKCVASAIKNMVIRGAPAIGIAAAMGIALGAQGIKTSDTEVFLRKLDRICSEMAQTRPTAVNLFWAIDHMKALVSTNRNYSVDRLKRILISEAQKMLYQDIEVNKRMGVNGMVFIKDGNTILTYCNAGALATGGCGTALGVIRAAHESGKRLRVLAAETRPFLQGARLTAWELKKDGIPVTLVTDNMVGYFMKRGDINLVMVGADRIAANGDMANKIGTYSVATLAKVHKIPFYVAAPISTLDLSLKSGSHIPIEERDPQEVTHICGKRVAPKGVTALNPAFDVTPNRYITAIITEMGVATRPFSKSLRALVTSRKTV
ncbi:MAG TPA: S-methyl-5-thioribose-1-phosphate isomerase [Syntrophaceae bacterium]|nr:S-methyl-5-thioribose-1-phosphate isomerase [Syntrophaceae bacterium]